MQENHANQGSYFTHKRECLQDRGSKELQDHLEMECFFYQQSDDQGTLKILKNTLSSSCNFPTFAEVL